MGICYMSQGTQTGALYQPQEVGGRWEAISKGRGHMYTHGLPCGSAAKEPSCNVGDVGLIRGLGSYPGEGKGYALQYSGLKNSMDCIVHGVTKNQFYFCQFSLLISTFQFYLFML